MKHPVEYWRSTGLISPEKLEDALHRQVIYGGSFDTVLLELELIDSTILCEQLNAALGFTSVLNHWLLSACRDLSLPQTDNIKSYVLDGWVAPLRLENDQLWLALHPESNERQHQIIRESCPDAELTTIPECCLIKLISRCGGPPPSNRYAGLCHSFLQQLPRDLVEEAPPELAETKANLPPTTEINEPALDRNDVLESPTIASNLQSKPDFDPAQVRTKLNSAKDRSSLIHALLDGAQYFTERVAVFAVRSDGLYSTPDEPQLNGVGDAIIPLSKELKRAISGEMYIEYTRDLDLRLAVGLEDTVPCILAPIAVNQKTIFMLYADRKGESFSDDEVRIVHELCGWAGMTLWEIIKSNRIRSTASAPSKSSEGSIRNFDKLASDPNNRITKNPPPFSQNFLESTPPVPTEILSARIQPGPPPILPQVIALQQPHDAIDDNDVPSTFSNPPLDDEQRTDIVDLPPHFSESGTPSGDPFYTALKSSKGETDDGLNTDSISESESSNPSDSPVIRPEPADPTPPTDHSLPTNHAEPANLEVVQQAFHEALSDPTQVSNLLQFGDCALVMIAAEFPGSIDLLRYDRENPPPPSAHGPLMRLILEAGNIIGPHILPHLERGNETQRFYAAFIFQELRDDRCMPLLGNAAFDPSRDVRTIAMRVLETYRHRPRYDQVVAHVRQNLASDNLSRVGRCTRAMGILRDIGSIPRLIELLGNKNRQLQEAALEALVSITGQQLGLRKGRWRGWYADNANRPRIEWLIQALDHHDASVYGWASDELQRITGHIVQTDHSPTKEQRHATIEEWSAWWRNTQEEAKSQNPMESAGSS